MSLLKRLNQESQGHVSSNPDNWDWSWADEFKPHDPQPDGRWPSSDSSSANLAEAGEWVLPNQEQAADQNEENGFVTKNLQSAWSDPRSVHPERIGLPGYNNLGNLISEVLPQDDSPIFSALPPTDEGFWGDRANKPRRKNKESYALAQHDLAKARNAHAAGDSTGMKRHLASAEQNKQIHESRPLLDGLSQKASSGFDAVNTWAKTTAERTNQGADTARRLIGRTALSATYTGLVRAQKTKESVNDFGAKVIFKASEKYSDSVEAMNKKARCVGRIALLSAAITVAGYRTKRKTR